MSNLVQLLEGVEVEWKTLGEVAGYEQPTKYLVSSKNYENRFKTPVLTAGKTFILGYTDETEGIYKASESPVIIFDDFTTANKWVDFDFKAKSSAMKMITSKDQSIALIKYIYYWLNTLPSGLVEGDHNRQWISNYANLQIPIPPLTIQKEIVRILDTFTDYTAELTAELTARKKQYNYYRDKLLSFEEGEVVWKSLGEVFDIVAGGDVPKQAFSEIKTDEFNIPILSNGIGKNSLYGWTNIPKIEKPSLTISARGTIGWTSYREKPFFPIVRLIVLTPKTELNVKFAYYYMKTIEDKYNVPQNGIPQLTKPMVKDISFPIPNLKEQERIVTILDKFDILTTFITDGLPKEIELRKKQYEYYRDLLLTFPKKQTA
jgi:type I restriction enzyme S subunit